MTSVQQNDKVPWETIITTNQYAGWAVQFKGRDPKTIISKTDNYHCNLSFMSTSISVEFRQDRLNSQWTFSSQVI